MSLAAQHFPCGERGFDKGCHCAAVGQSAFDGL